MPTFNKHPEGRSLESYDYFQVPVEEQIEIAKQKHEDKKPSPNLFYIKLHGSTNWQTKVGNRKVMVIGGNKIEQIISQPLLNWYFEIFKQVLSCPDRRLLIIGYGFGDDHINKVISNAVQKHGLQVYVVSRDQPKQLRKFGIKIYWDKPLEEIYPAGKPYGSTLSAQQIQRIMFDTEAWTNQHKR
jgi:hypothetical protein